MDKVISELTEILGKPSSTEKNKFGKPVISWQMNSERAGFRVGFGPDPKMISYDISDGNGYGTIGSYCDENQICWVAQKVAANVNPITIICS